MTENFDCPHCGSRLVKPDKEHKTIECFNCGKVSNIEEAEEEA